MNVPSFWTAIEKKRLYKTPSSSAPGFICKAANCFPFWHKSKERNLRFNSSQIASLGVPVSTLSQNLIYLSLDVQKNHPGSFFQQNLWKMTFDDLGRMVLYIALDLKVRYLPRLVVFGANIPTSTWKEVMQLLAVKLSIKSLQFRWWIHDGMMMFWKQNRNWVHLSSNNHPQDYDNTFRGARN